MRTVIAIIFAAGILVWSGCGVARQIEEAKAFAKCEFELKAVENTHLADVSIQNVRSVKDLSIKKGTKLIDAMTEKEVPLTFDLIIHAENPNTKPAAMNRLEWILFIDGNQMVNGALEQKVQIPDSSSVDFPLAISIDLKKALSGSSGDAMMKLAFNVAGEGKDPSRILIKAKPSIDIAGMTIEYPGYIDIKAKVTAEQGKENRKKVKTKLEKKAKG